MNIWSILGAVQRGSAWHIFCWSLATCAGYDCPLSQYHLADALGLTAVHVNRVLRELREAGLLTFQRSRVTYGNYDALVQYAGFETGYLDQERPLVA